MTYSIIRCFQLVKLKSDLGLIATATTLSIAVLAILSGNIIPAFASDPGGTFFPRLDIDSQGGFHR